MPNIKLLSEPLSGTSGATPPPASTLPPAHSRQGLVQRIMGSNDQYGDCLEVAAVNAIATKKGLANADFIPIQNSVPLALYSTISGFNPDDPSTDVGTTVSGLFSYWSNTPISGWILSSYTPIDPADSYSIRNTIKDPDYGGVLLILNLSLSQKNQVVWQEAGSPGTWGPHAVFCDQYEGGQYGCTSWGLPKWISQDFFDGEFVVGAYSMMLTQV